ncbi:uncharacterized protein LOC114336291 [Diabrotica virgifera virgifera]|uniref:Cyclic nucleotide-binding domain-containing protein n=1 Tax=Diabrotica virgifera virgifera TaxID=50390 RepID=A0ABM5JMH5_DIAVI|nr:uncharacterized protein LOC114336291 [Diabrotica virgifera virgifera]
MSKDTHNCLLTRQTQTSSFAPQHPSANWHGKLLHCIKKWLTLNENDIRCRNFLKTGSALRAEQRKHSRGKYWYIIHPFSILSLVVELVFLVTVLHRMTFTITTIIYPKWYQISAKARDVIHGICMVTFFFTGYVDRKTKRIFIKTSQTAKHYLLTYFLVDLFLIFEDNSDAMIHKFLHLMQVDEMHHRETRQLFAVPINMMAFICYYIRLRSCTPIITNIFLNFGFGRQAIFVVTHLVIGSFILNTFAFLVYDIPVNVYIRNNSYFPNDSWIILRNQSFYVYTRDTYMESLLLVICYFFGSYHYDVIKQPCEQLMMFLITFMGRAYVLVIVGRILANFGASDRAEIEYENMWIQLQSFMHSLDVPLYLQNQIGEKFEYNYQKKFFNTQQMIKVLTSHLRTELFLFGSKKLISMNAFLKLLTSQELGALFSRMRSTVYSSNEVVLGNYRSSNNVFFILSGTVAVFVGETEAFHLQDGDLFGIFSIFSDTTHNDYDLPIFVLTLEPTEIYYVNKRWIVVHMESKADVYRYFHNIYIKRIQLTTEAALRRRRTGQDVRDLLKTGSILEKRRKRTINIE